MCIKVVARELDAGGGAAGNAGTSAINASKDIGRAAQQVASGAGSTTSGKLVAVLAPEWGKNVHDAGDGMKSYGTALHNAAAAYRKTDHDVACGTGK